MERRPTALAAVLILIGSAGSGCQRGSVNANRECLGLIEQKKYEAAVTTCQALFDRDRDPQVGLATARAHYALGRDDQALTWPERLAGSPQEGAGWDIAADARRRRKEPDLEKEARLKALALHRDRQDLKPLARSQYALFYSAWQRSDFLLAFTSARDAYDSALAAGDAPMARTALEGLFTALYEIGDLDGAKGALARLEPLEAGTDREALARYWTHAGAVRMAEGRWNLARDALKTALQSLAGSENVHLLRAIHLNLAESQLELGELGAAEEELTRAWRYAEPDAPSTALLYATARHAYQGGRLDAAMQSLDRARQQDPVSDWAWDIECLRGRVEEHRRRPRAALEAYEGSTRIVDKMRASAATDEFKAWLLDQRREPFERLFRLQASDPRRRLAALETAERAKARDFLDAFVRGVRDPSLPADGWNPGASAQRLELLQSYFQTGSTSPLAVLRPAPDLLRQIGDRQVFFYFEARPDLWLIRLGGRTVSVQRLGEAAAATRLMESFAARPDDPEAAWALGRLLFPAASLPAPGTILYVVTDGALDRIPLAALRVGDQFLAQAYPLSYVPSVNALLAIEGSSEERADAPSAVLGDPRGDLPAARAEAVEVARHLGIEPVLGSKATLASFRAMGSGRLLHVASHLETSAAGTRLVFADGAVGPREVMEWRIKPQVVVLASCLGAARPSRGAWGSLSAAFLASGSQAVVAALSSVEDRSTREFMSEFYRQGGALQPSQALASAQRTFIAAGRPPSFWSPLVVLGSGRPVRARK